MKRNYFITLLILLLAASISGAQSKFTETITTQWTNSSAVMQQSFTVPSGFTYSGQTGEITTYGSSTTNMGMIKENIGIQVRRQSDGIDTTITVERKTTYRTNYSFPLTSIKYTSTNNINITNVKINYSTTGYNYTFKITQPNSFPVSDQETWTTVGSSTARQTGITYSGSVVNPASGLAAPIKSSLASGYIYLGVLSESESTNGSDAQMGYGFSLEITYERDNEARTVTAQNDLHSYTGGQIYWDGGLVESPHSPALYENETHTFAVKTPQTVESYNYIWHQGATNTSEWRKQISGGGSTPLGSNTSVSYTTVWNEVGTITHTAYMRRICNVTFTGGGGTVTIDGGAAQSFPQTRQVIESNPITATASNYSSGGFNYTFLNSWTTSGGQVVSTTINPSQHETYTANYSSSISGSVTLQSNIIIPTGSSFTIPSGATVNLNGHSIISTGGTINKQGTITGLRAKLGPNGENGYCGSIQTAINYSDYNNNIYIQSGAFTENISISNKSSIIYVYGDGQYSSYINGNINITNSYYPQLYDISTRFLSISSCNNPRIGEVLIVPWSEEAEGSLFSNSNTNLYLIDVTLNDTPDSFGAYFSGSTGQVYKVNGTYFENNQLATYFINNSSFTLTNVYFCNNDYDISTDGSSSVQAVNATFSGNPNVTTSGNVSWGGYSTCGMLKNSSTVSNITEEKDASFEDFNILNNSYQEILKNINNESEGKIFDKEKYLEDFKSLIEGCKSFISSNTTSQFASTVVNLAAHSYKQIEDYEGLKTFAEEIIKDKNLTGLHGYAKRQLMDYYTIRKNYATAISKADEILKENKIDEDLICDVMLAKGLLYEYLLGETEEAIKIYEEMLSSYPQNKITKFVKQQLKNLGKELPETQEITQSDEKLAFNSSNYPNPFNPTTIISYTLPEEGKVQVKIFDILGREVETLVDNVIAAGTHKLEWNGSNFASGIYFYSVTFKNQTLHKKMLMIK